MEKFNTLKKYVFVNKNKNKKFVNHNATNEIQILYSHIFHV